MTLFAREINSAGDTEQQEKVAQDEKSPTHYFNYNCSIVCKCEFIAVFVTPLTTSKARVAGGGAGQVRDCHFSVWLIMFSTAWRHVTNI